MARKKSKRKIRRKKTAIPFLKAFEYLTPGQAAKVLGVSYLTVYRWIKKGILKAKKKGNRHYIPLKEVLRLKEFKEKYGVFPRK